MARSSDWRWCAIAPVSSRAIGVIEPAEKREDGDATHPFGFSRALQQPERALDGKTPVDELILATEPGWPRALWRASWKPRAYPLPWINNLNPAFERTGFKQLDEGRVMLAEKEGICFCCGEVLRKLQVMGRHRASIEGVHLTDGPAGHPRCVALAAEHCPHLRNQHKGDEGFVIALVWRGQGLGYVKTPHEMMVDGSPRLVVRPEATTLTLGELRKLAKDDPLGVG